MRKSTTFFFKKNKEDDQQLILTNMTQRAKVSQHKKFTRQSFDRVSIVKTLTQTSMMSYLDQDKTVPG